MPRSDVSGEYIIAVVGSAHEANRRTRRWLLRLSNGVFSGEIEGRVARVAWTETEDGGRSKYRGTATFVVAPDRSIVRGIYFARRGKRCRNLGPRGAARRRAATALQTARHGLAEELQHNGRVVLYGIHFDSGSDVPRPDSDPTLQRFSRRCSRMRR